MASVAQRHGRATSGMALSCQEEGAEVDREVVEGHRSEEQEPASGQAVWDQYLPRHAMGSE